MSDDQSADLPSIIRCDKCGRSIFDHTATCSQYGMPNPKPSRRVIGFRIRWGVRGVYVHARFFSVSGGASAFLGSLTFNRTEWDAFRSTLAAASFDVIHDDVAEAIASASKIEPFEEG